MKINPKYKSWRAYQRWVLMEENTLYCVSIDLDGQPYVHKTYSWGV